MRNWATGKSRKSRFNKHMTILELNRRRKSEILSLNWGKLMMHSSSLSRKNTPLKRRKISLINNITRSSRKTIIYRKNWINTASTRSNSTEKLKSSKKRVKQTRSKVRKSGFSKLIRTGSEKSSES